MQSVFPPVLSAAYKILSNFADSSDFWQVFETAFGSLYDFSKAEAIRSQWQAHDFSNLPGIEVISSEVLGHAVAAYAASTNKIYLSEDFLNTAPSAAIQSVLLEEVGHFVDAQINQTDRPGEEGAIFSALVQGESLDASALQALRAEDDHATITLNGQVISVDLSGADRSNNTLGTAFNAGALSGTRIFTGFIGTTEPVDYYQFSLTGTSDVSLQLSGLSQSYVNAYLYYDANNNGVIDNGEQLYSTYAGVGGTAQINATLGASGNYFVGIVPNQNVNSNYSLQLAATASPPSLASDPGNILSTAYNIGNLTSARTFKEFVGNTDPVDFYKFSLTGTSDVSLQLGGLSQGYVSAYLYYDANNNGLIDNGEQLYSTYAGVGGTAQINATLGASGNYFVGIVPNQNVNSNYSLQLAATASPPSITPDPGNTLSTAYNIGNLTSARTFKEFVGNTDPVDFYKFSLTGTSDVSLQLGGLSQGYVSAYLYYDANNNGLIDNGEQLYSTYAGVGGTAQINATLGASGNYFVGIVPNQNVNSNYSLQLAATAAPPSIAPDPGNTLSTAYNIGNLVGTQTFKEFVGNTDPVDFYKFSLTGTSDVSLQLGGLSQGYVSAYIYKDANNNGLIDSGEQLDSTYTGVGGTAQITKTLQAGNYYVGIAPNQNVNSNYSLTLVNAASPNPGTTVNLSVAPASVLENSTNSLVYTFTRTGATTNALTVNYNVGGTATFNTDYTQTGASTFTASTGTVTFAAGSATATVAIKPVADTVPEPNEIVSLTLTSGTSYTAGTSTPVTGTIIDASTLVPGTLAFSSAQFSVRADGTPLAAVTISRKGGSTGTVSATLNLRDGTAQSPSDYSNAPITVTFADGETSKTVMVPVVRETGQPDKTLQLTLTSPTGGATIAQQNSATLTILGSGTPIISFPQGASGSNQGQVTIAITGQNFSPTDQISLVAPNGTTRTASKTYSVNGNQTWATFDLQGLSAGKYDIKVANGSNGTTAPAAFTVTSGPVGNVQTKLSYPAPGVVTVTYTNIGQTDVAAPILQVFGANVQPQFTGIEFGLKLVSSGQGTGTTGQLNSQLIYQGLGSSSAGPAGILAPGESGQFSFNYTPSGNGAINYTVQQANPGDVIDWASQKAQFYTNFSNYLSPTAWDLIWNNFTNAVGNTYGSLQAVLDRDATYLSQTGDRNFNFSSLLAFELEKAGNSLANDAIAAARDAFEAAPGLSLSFTRTFYNGLFDRYQQGALGLGWSSNWDLSLSVDAQGNVTVFENGTQRFFTKQSDGSYAGLPGDYGRLTLTSNKYTLQETDGTVLSFRGVNQPIAFIIQSPGNTSTTYALDYVQDPNGNRITANYTGNRLTSLVQSNGERLTLSYNSQGDLSQITDSTGETTTYRYDASGQHLLSVTTAQGTTSYTYDTTSGGAKQNTLLSITNPDNTHTYFTYDAQGRLASQSQDGGAQAITYTYDPAGAVQARDALGNAVSLSPNIIGQANQTKNALGSTVQASYDSNHNLTSLTAPGGLTATYSYDSQGNVVRSVDPLGNSLSLTYTSTFNELQTLTDQRGNITRYTYDARGNLTGITYADGSSERYSSNAQGQVTQSVDRSGNQINYTYNSQGRLTSQTYSSAANNLSYTYDAHGNLTAATDANGTTTLIYDAADRLTRITYANGRSLSYTYDVGGRRTSVTDQTGFTTRYLYDAAGRLTGLTDGTNHAIATYTYDAAGRLSKQVDGNGNYTTYTYDAAGEVTSLINYKANNTVNSSFVYTYNNVGQRISETTLDGTWTYTYDATGQLTNAVLASTNTAIANQNLTYVYDAAGNRIKTIQNGTTTNYNANNLNEYTSAGNTIYSYDRAGNLIAKVSNGQTTTYGYDANNRLISVTGPDGTWTYQYDALGNRIASTHNGQTSQYLIDPITGNIIGQYDGSGNLTADYTYGFGLNSQVTGSNASYYDFDALGSTVGLAGANGSYVDRYSYDPFGNSLSTTGSVNNPFQYVGQYDVINSGNGLYLMGAREYDPTTGRFTQTDPIGLNGKDTNLYRYAGNNPVSFIDPSGKDFFSIGSDILKGGFRSALGAYYGTLFGAIIAIPIGIAGVAIGFPLALEGALFLAVWAGGGLGAALANNSEVQDYVSDKLIDFLWGDTHLTTLDGTHYDFQGAGEFTLVKSTTDDFEIQVRQQPWGGSTKVTVATAIALKIDGQRIGFYLNDPNPVKVNGTAVTIANGGLYAVGSTLITHNGGTYDIFTANGDHIQVSSNGSYMNLGLGFADNRKGHVVGLLGNDNGTPTDDFALRNGTVIGGTITNQQLYGDYANSWRITQPTSLLDYNPGQTTASFTDLTFPNTIVTSTTLTPAQRAAALQTAQAAGITDPTLLEDAILDIAQTNGAPEFIQGYVTQQHQVTLSAPNTLINPDGFGNAHWLAANALIPETIRFTNNAAQGSTPIAQVTITQQLDTDLDLNTFSLSTIRFGAITLTIPTGTKNYSQRLDLRSTQGVYVDVNAGLNPNTGVVTWTFTAIDPATGNPANSASKGFLPPNDSTGAGQGFVGYSIQPKANSTTSTRIDDRASITFNNQASTQTDSVFNTLDGDLPTSTLSVLSVAGTPNFTVSWAGADSSSGIAGYDILVSTDRGAFTPWQTNTPTTTATYNGQSGHTYAFRSVAHDNVGNLETTPAVIPTLSINNISVAESTTTTSNNAIFTVTLSSASQQPVTVNYATANGSAIGGADYTAVSGNLRFAAGETTKTISVPILSDTLIEPNETFLITLNGSTNATLATAQGLGTIQSQIPPGPPAIDFNQDGQSDLVWRNYATGQNAIWLMKGTSFSQGVFTAPVADPNWSLVGTGDFNQDGQSDLVWRNYATGQNAIWLMKGTSFSQGVFTAPVADPNWSLVGTGDFNQDGQSDLVWRNYATGQNAIWLMKGTSFSQGVFTAPVADPNWSLVGTGDFNQDGQSDLVWRNYATGQNAIWLMKGTSFSQGVFTAPVADPNWSLVGTGDFNQDGQSDLVWRNGSSGKNAVWLMNGTALSQGLYLNTDVADLNWRLGNAYPGNLSLGSVSLF